MSSFRYVSRAGWIAEALRESLSPEDQEALRADCAQLGVEGWRQWERANRDEANDYLRATPKQRVSKKKWADPLLRRRLTLAAYHQGNLAVRVLEEKGVLPGLGYREATAWAAGVAGDARKALVWPYEGRRPPGWKSEDRWEIVGYRNLG